jgi:hypothetical protein
MWKIIASSAVVGGLLMVFSVTARFNGPSEDKHGEAQASIFCVVVDGVPIPHEPEGKLVMRSGRIENGYLVVMAGAVTLGFLAGATVGWSFYSWRQKLSAIPAPHTGVNP